MTDYRLDQFLQKTAGVSRKEAGKMIRGRWVTVNGETITSRDYKVSVTDKIYLDDELLIHDNEHRYFVLYKPAGYVSSHRHDGHLSLFTLLDEPVEDLHIAGRLDADTTGLVLITDDGAWSHAVTHPKGNQAFAKVKKVYDVELAAPITAEMIQALETGVMLKGETTMTRPAEVIVIDSLHIQLILIEGRYHQVKRMLAAIGNRVEKLHRAAIGNITLEGLAVGEYRALTVEEREGLIDGRSK